jgi:hypothetical protein
MVRLAVQLFCQVEQEHLELVETLLCAVELEIAVLGRCELGPKTTM